MESQAVETKLEPQRPECLSSGIPEPPKIHFTTHLEDPRLSLAAAGRLVGYHRMTISRLCDDGFLQYEKDERGLRRVRQSELVRFFRLTAHARKSNYFWIKQADLPDDYEYLESYPRPRVSDDVTYFPVPINNATLTKVIKEESEQNGETQISGDSGSSIAS